MLKNKALKSKCPLVKNKKVKRQEILLAFNNLPHLIQDQVQLLKNPNLKAKRTFLTNLQVANQDILQSKPQNQMNYFSKKFIECTKI